MICEPGPHASRQTISQPANRLRKNSVYTQYTVGILHNGDDVKIASGCSKIPSSKAAASEEARRYKPHFVWPFTPRIVLGERISPASVSDLRKVLFNVEPLSDARTVLAGFFSILLNNPITSICPEDSL
jgi:hypothetical protein